jgi:hypothetical protein
LKNLDRILDITQQFNAKLIIGNPYNKEETYNYYKNYCGYTVEQIEAAEYKHMYCGDIARAFQSLLRKQGIETHFIFMYHVGIKNWFDLKMPKTYVDKLVGLSEEPYAILETPIFDESMERGTHAVLMDSEMEYVIDPTAGVIYPYTIEDLKQYPEDVKASLLYKNQYEFIKKSPHLCRGYCLTYVSPVFWKHITTWHKENY